jgi:hypothetical protein
MALTKVSTGVVDMSGDTGGLVIAKGTDAQQPTCDASILGSIRENTTKNKVEACTSTGWRFLEEVGSTAAPLIVDYLIVGGGGAGASGYGGVQGGSGGGGGFITSLPGGSGGGSSSESPFPLTVGTQYAVTVGSGAASVYTLTPGQPTSGGDSSVFNSFTALGGGSSRSYTSGNTKNSAGRFLYASGGGGTYTGGPGGSGPGSGNAASRGYDGGNGTYGVFYGGGGGGAGGLGSNTVGGAGKLNAITGNTSLSYSGGGGNSWGNPRGGAGQSSQSGGNGFSGVANTGGGGGGGLYNGGNGGNGGSGVVILRYPNSYTTTKTNTLISSVSTSVAGYKIESFTSGTGTITFS